MKISKWEELDGLKGEYAIEVKGYCITIAKRNCFKDEYTSAIRLEAGKEIILSWLKVFGFDVEFEEPPKLSKKAWHYVNYLPDECWLAKDKNSIRIYIYSSKPERKGCSEWIGICSTSVEASLFPFITSDRAWSVKELRELEVEDE